jgi:hypothetical protein
MNDPVEWGKKFAKTVKEHVKASVESLRLEFSERFERQNGEIEALKARQPEKGDKGDSVTVEDVQPIVEGLVAKAIAALPKPKDGENGKSVSVDDVLPALLQELQKAVDSFPRPADGKDYDPDVLQKSVQDAVAAIPAPRDGQDGVSITLDDVRPLIEDGIGKAVASIPKPKDGVDGKSVTVDELRPVVEDLISRAVEAIPRPKDGEDGQSVTAEQLVPLIAPAVEAKAIEIARAAIENLPRPRDGIDGKSVTTDDLLPVVRDWFDRLPKPKDGVDGKSVSLEDVSDFMESAIAKWALDFERRAQDLFQRAVEKIPVPKNGLDGLGFDDLSVIHDGERSFTLRFARGEQIKEFPIVLPIVIDRGYHKDGNSYAKGDGVTHGGSYWIAQNDTTSKPEIGNPDFRLAVKKGRDGKDYSPKAATPREPMKVGASR